MIPTFGETYELKLIKRKPNSPYEYEETPSLTFKGRPAGTMEKRIYRIQQGVNGGNDSVYVVATNLPEDVKVADKVIFLGKEWQVASIGYYYDNNRIVNASVMSNDYIISRCPKGINLQ